MLLLIVRHAQAAEQDPKKYPDDSLRPLTTKGREIHAEISRLLRKRKLIPDAIYSSPWKRAMQTASIMARELGGKSLKPKPISALADVPDLDAIHKELEGAERLETVALVGHEPWLGSLASLLLTGEPHRLSIDFPKSGVIGIEVDAIESGAGMLRFFLRPKFV